VVEGDLGNAEEGASFRQAEHLVAGVPGSTVLVGDDGDVVTALLLDGFDSMGSTREGREPVLRGSSLRCA
jgi:hypothetical protein